MQIRKSQTDNTFNNIAASSPLVTDDSSLGYDVGSQWFNSVSKVVYECEDATVGAAVWTAIAGGSVSGTGTDNHIARWDGTTNIQDSGPIIGDSGEMIIEVADNTNLSAQKITQHDVTFETYAQELIVDHTQAAQGLEGRSAGGQGVGQDYYHNSPSPLSGDALGILNFYGKNSLGTKTRFGYIQGSGDDITATSEDGSFLFGVLDGGAQKNKMQLRGGLTGIEIFGPSFSALIDSSLIAASSKTFTLPNASGTVALETGASGSFTTTDLKTVTVVNGIITSIV